MNEQETGVTVELQGAEMVDEFKYLGQTIQATDSEKGVEWVERSQGWFATEGQHRGSKNFFYKTLVSPAMIYGLEMVMLTKR